MRIVTAEEIDCRLDRRGLVETLRQAFRDEIEVPPRHHHPLTDTDATLLLMPAWQRGGEGFAGVKIVSVFPGNAARGKATVQGAYLLLDGGTGEPLALIDGPALTLWRTAAASALAGDYLARADSAHLVMIGAGALAAHLVEAHAATRPIARVSIWNRSAGRAEALAERLDRPGFQVRAAENLEAAVAEADIVSSATLSATPLVRGAWLRPGTHVDLVGAYTPAMREADDAAVSRATVYVDTLAGALAEAGDIRLAIEGGALRAEGIAGDLAVLCRGTAPGRRSDDEITLFKSVGTALEDLAAAAAIWRKLGAG